MHNLAAVEPDDMDVARFFVYQSYAGPSPTGDERRSGSQSGPHG
jgi:hypothetical protein